MAGGVLVRVCMYGCACVRAPLSRTPRSMGTSSAFVLSSVHPYYYRCCRACDEHRFMTSTCSSRCFFSGVCFRFVSSSSNSARARSLALAGWHDRTFYRCLHLFFCFVFPETTSLAVAPSLSVCVGGMHRDTTSLRSPESGGEGLCSVRTRDNKMRRLGVGAVGACCWCAYGHGSLCSCDSLPLQLSGGV